MAILLVSHNLTAQSGQATIGGSTPDPSAVLDMQSTDKGFLLPRLSTAERNAIVNPAHGLVIFNTVTLCMEINQGTSSAPQWERAKCRTGIITTLDCGSASVSGQMISIPYTGGNGGVYEANSAASSGVTGLTAALTAGNYTAGGGSLSWVVSGVPSSVGTAAFSLSAGGYTCSVPFTVVSGTIASLNCAGAAITGTLLNGQSASGVSASVPYTGGDGGFHSGQTVTSTGVTGLTATLSGGGFASGTGSLSYSITGTPASGGTASFALNIGGQTCTLDVTVIPVCRAKVNATDYKNFMCYNLGAANTSADPFTPGWEINGGYWQWGRLVQAAAGPTGSGSGQANGGVVSGWNTTYAANGDWADGTKTANDPCPAGYRVPTKEQWAGVIANNNITYVGSFSSSNTNYGAGVKLGDELMLPAAGNRDPTVGALTNRGNNGNYWSTMENITNPGGSLYMFFNSSIPTITGGSRTSGRSVRCVAE